MTFETPLIFGADRFTWSRKLFNEALAIVTRLGTATDLEMVQCFYMLVSKVFREVNLKTISANGCKCCRARFASMS